jgi:hypothetical protein
MDVGRILMSPRSEKGELGAAVGDLQEYERQVGEEGEMCLEHSRAPTLMLRSKSADCMKRMI